MRLVIATPLYPPEPGGPATYAALLADALPKAGIEVEVVKFSEVRHLPKLIRHIAYYRKIYRAARHADAVFALDPVSTGLPALHAARHAKKPFFIKIVGDYAWEQGTQRFGVTASLDAFQTISAGGFVKRLRDIQTHVANAATRVIVPSAYLKKIVASWGIPEDRIAVIYNSVSVHEVGTTPQEVMALPHPTLVTVGRLVPWKGIEGLIRAVQEARRHIPDLSLVVVGEGPERPKLEASAKTLLGKNYVFTGALSHRDTLATIKAADMFALNTSYEGFSHLLLEAALLQVPILTTKSGGNTELLSPEAAVFFEVDDTAHIAEGILRLYSESGLREHLTHEAYTQVYATFTTEALITELKKVLTV